jgi:hypothetical protein
MNSNKNKTQKTSSCKNYNLQFLLCFHDGVDS